MSKTQPSVLIVDDESFIRLLLLQTLEELAEQGVRMLTAADGQEALELAIAERPDVILLDVMMPELDGYAVCQRVKQEAEDIYIILLTAKGQAMDKEQGRVVRADEYVTKPFDPDYVLERVAELLGMDVII
ncbi:MAG: response regulator [Anaerolineae bacterium]|nr:response regulator [Anaerolineae bacterium]